MLSAKLEEMDKDVDEAYGKKYEEDDVKEEMSKKYEEDDKDVKDLKDDK